jgi:lipid-binding SYLF domain-containing protein
MITRRVLAFSALMGAAVGGRSVIPVAAATTDQQDLVRQALATVDEARHDTQFGTAPALFRRARAVMVVPQLVKGGFIFGGEGGNGVLLARMANGSWSQPAFYAIGSASFGLQIGVEVAELILFVMSERALQAWMQNEFKLGAAAGLTVLVVGTNAQAAATTNANVDIIAWSKAKGVYGGITLEGSVIKARDEWNEAYYGRRVTPRDVISANAIENPGSRELRAALAG